MRIKGGKIYPETRDDLLCPRCHKSKVLREFDYLEDFGTPKVMLKEDWGYITCSNCGWTKWDEEHN